MTICEQCGSRNPESAETCYSCGARLHQRDEGQPTIIDISGDQTEIVTEKDRERVGPFGNAQFGPARIYQVRGGNRSCLIVVVAVLLVVCCVCAGWWTVADNIFF
ncbi:hypothetical protein BH24CHL1_BH24CHL1_12320 [soil metagenome]